MAKRRMFDRDLVCNPTFESMGTSTKYLFFMLCLYADDEGVVVNPKGVARWHRCTQKDLDNLYANHYLIPFESGVAVIKHWFAHNYRQMSHITNSTYQEELSTLELTKNGFYTTKNKDFRRRNAAQDCHKVPSSIDKVSIDKNRVVESSVVESTNMPDPVYQKLEFIFPNAPTTWLIAIDQYKNILSEELIINALQETASNGVNSPKYFKAICDRYILNGYKKISDINAKNTKNTKKENMSREEYNKKFAEIFAKEKIK